MAILPEVSEAIRSAADANNGEIPEAMRSTLGTIEEFITKTRFGLNWIPPYDESEEWRPLGRTLTDLIEGKSAQWEPAIADLQTLEELAPLAQQPDSRAFLDGLTAWQEDLTQRSADRGLEPEDTERTVKSPRLSPIIPAGFHGTWTHHSAGLHPRGEEPWVLTGKTFQAHETYADVRFVIIHGSHAITVILNAASEGEEWTEEKYLKLSQNGNRLEMKRTEGAESGLVLYRVTSLAKDKLNGEEKYIQSWQDEELKKLKDDPD
jgi:hypothetical protein